MIIRIWPGTRGTLPLLGAISLLLWGVSPSSAQVASPAPDAPAAAPSEAASEAAPVPAAEAEPQPLAPVAVESDVPAATVSTSAQVQPVATEEAAPSEPAEEDWYHEHSVATDEEGFVPGKGLSFESDDGLFSLELRLRAQFLYQIGLPYDREADAYGDAEQGMQIRRARVQFGGNMWGKKTSYKVELAISPGDLGMTNTKGNDNSPVLDNRDSAVTRSLLLDWYMQFSQLRDLNLRVGQYKVSYSRDRVISSGNLQFVDRTILNNEFNVDRDIGIDVRSKDLFGLGKKLRYYLGVYNGEGHSYAGQDDFGLMYLGRIEVLPFGDFDDYSQSDLDRGQKPGLSLGVAYARIQNAKGNKGILGKRPVDGGTTDYDNLTVDATFKLKGYSLELAYFYRDGTRDGGDAVDDTDTPIPVEAARNGWGAGAQTGYLLPTTNFEIALRYSVIRASDKTTSLKDSNEAGVGLNYFFAQHPYKLQADYLRLWGDGAKDGGTTLAKAENLFRMQLQASF